MKLLFPRGQQGFSIVQGMILAAAVAGMALIGTKLSTDQKQMIKGVESKNRVEQLHQLIYSIVQNRDHCAQTLTLSGLTLPARLTTTTPQEVLAIATAGTGSVASAAFRKVGATYDASAVYMNNSVSINDMSITYPANFANLAKLRITYGRVDSKNMATRTGKGTASADVTKTIDIKVQRNINTGAFESCYASTASENENTIKDFCEDLGSDGNDATPSLFVWNAAYQTCTLQSTSCPSGQIYAGFDANGNRLCNTVQDWVDMNQILDNTTPPDCAGKDIRFEIVGQKVRIKCDGGTPVCSNPPPCPAQPSPSTGVWTPGYGGAPNASNGTVLPNWAHGPGTTYITGDVGGNFANCYTWTRSSTSCQENRYCSWWFDTSTPATASCDSFSVGGNSCDPGNSYWDGYSPWEPCSGGVEVRKRSCWSNGNLCGTCTGCNGPECPEIDTDSRACAPACPPGACTPVASCPSFSGWNLDTDYGGGSSWGFTNPSVTMCTIARGAAFGAISIRNLGCCNEARLCSYKDGVGAFPEHSCM